MTKNPKKHNDLADVSVAKTTKEKMIFSSGYARGMRDGIIGNYVVVFLGLILSLLIVYWLKLI